MSQVFFSDFSFNLLFKNCRVMRFCTICKILFTKKNEGHLCPQNTWSFDTSEVFINE